MNRITESEPTVLVESGQVMQRALAKERMTIEELHSQLRLQGIERIDEVQTATLEPNGHVSVLRQEWAKPVEKCDLQRARDEARA